MFIKDYANFIYGIGRRVRCIKLATVETDYLQQSLDKLLSNVSAVVSYIISFEITSRSIQLMSAFNFVCKFTCNSTCRLSVAGTISLLTSQ